MFSNQNTNSNTEAQQLQHANNITPSSEDLLKEMQSLRKVIEIRGKEIELLKSRGRREEIMGIANLSLSSVMAAAFTIAVIGFALGPIIAGYTVAGIVATAALTGLGATVYQYRKEIKSGFKYAAEKTVDGAKYTAEKVKDASVYTAGKIKDGAVRAKSSVKEAASSVAQATREGTSSALRTMGNGVQKLGEGIRKKGASMSALDRIPYSIGPQNPTFVLKTEEKTENFNSLKEMFIKEVFEGKAVDNSVLVKKILSELKGKILEKGYSVDGQQSFKKDQLINQLGQQVDFVSKLNSKKLQNLLAQDDNNLYEIFSEHHSEIQKIIGECKTEHKLSNSIEKLNNVAGKYGSRKGSTQSTSSASGNSLSDADSIKTDSTGETAAIGGRPGVARRNSTSNLIRVETPEVPARSTSLPNLSELGNTSGQNSFSEGVFNDPAVKRNLDSLSNSSNSLNSSPVPALVAPPKVPGSPVRSGSPDSGKGPSAPSTLERQSPSPEELTKARAGLKETGLRGKLVEQPSSQVVVNSSVQQQTQTAVKAS